MCLPSSTRECRLDESESVHMISSGAWLRYHDSPFQDKQRIGCSPSYSCWTEGGHGVGPQDSLVAVGVEQGSATTEKGDEHCVPQRASSRCSPTWVPCPCHGQRYILQGMVTARPHRGCTCGKVAAGARLRYHACCPACSAGMDFSTYREVRWGVLPIA
jgi:hypothetical protein